MDNPEVSNTSEVSAPAESVDWEARALAAELRAADLEHQVLQREAANAVGLPELAANWLSGANPDELAESAAAIAGALKSHYEATLQTSAPFVAVTAGREGPLEPTPEPVQNIVNALSRKL